MTVNENKSKFLLSPADVYSYKPIYRCNGYQESVIKPQPACVCVCVCVCVCQLSGNLIGCTQLATAAAASCVRHHHHHQQK